MDLVGSEALVIPQESNCKLLAIAPETTEHCTVVQNQLLLDNVSHDAPYLLRRGWALEGNKDGVANEF